MPLPYPTDVTAMLADVGVAVVNGATSTTGLVRVVDAVIDDGAGGVVQVRRRVVRVARGTAGTLASGSAITVAGVSYRIERIERDGADVWEDAYLAGGA